MAASTAAADETFQQHILQGVSRTFALTIPQLPPALARTVSNAYLLCRIADTIEDESALSAAQKKDFTQYFQAVVAGRSAAENFAAQLHPLLSGSTIAAERELVQNAAAVIRITHSLAAPERAALERCVSIMSEGMSWFQEQQSRQHAGGLPDLAYLNAYCYYVAGVVGEMLTQLFGYYSPQIAAQEAKMLALSVSFGQGLQMTNILKDIWEDHARGACWLPRSVFAQHGFDLAQLPKNQSPAMFNAGLTQMLAIAHGHLCNALEYTLMIPAQEPGLRKFCLWAIGMALLTLQKIHGQPEFSSGRAVKISRRSVRGVILLSNWSVRSDWALRQLFKLAARRLPPAEFTPLQSTAAWRSSIDSGRVTVSTPVLAGAV